MGEFLRFPAEWEPQSAVLIAWPHAGTDWAQRLDSVEATYVALVAAITRFQMVLVCIADPALEAHARRLLTVGAADLSRVRFERLPYDDTWLRDSGPITLREGDGFRLLDFHFTAWGGKFEAGRDDQLVSALCERGIFPRAQRQRVDFALEGGAVETDGQGTLLSTWRCLHERHPGVERTAITQNLQNWLSLNRTLWLEHGYLEGDDTDAHIDTLARFASPEAIVYQGCQDVEDSHFSELQAMAAELAQFRRRNGEPYRLFELPWPQPIVDGGRRLAASYANFLIINGAVLMPAYDDVADAGAARVLASAFPGREIVAVPCRSLIWQNGSLHCLTMQLPEGLIA
ncbi:MAG: agmatine deiminase family protein [Arenimonas sp.]